jgi:hypothetical protein
MDTEVPTFDPNISEEERERVELAHLERVLPVLQEARNTMAEAVGKMASEEEADLTQYQFAMEKLDEEAQAQVAAVHAQSEAEGVADVQQQLQSIDTTAPATTYSEPPVVTAAEQPVTAPTAEMPAETPAQQM